MKREGSSGLWSINRPQRQAGLPVRHRMTSAGWPMCVRVVARCFFFIWIGVAGWIIAYVFLAGWFHW